MYYQSTMRSNRIRKFDNRSFALDNIPIIPSLTFHHWRAGWYVFFSNWRYFNFIFDFSIFVLGTHYCSYEECRGKKCVPIEPPHNFNYCEKKTGVNHHVIIFPFMLAFGNLGLYFLFYSASVFSLNYSRTWHVIHFSFNFLVCISIKKFVILALVETWIASAWI